MATAVAPPSAKPRHFEKKVVFQVSTLKGLCHLCVLPCSPIFSASESFVIINRVSSVRGMYLLKQNWLLQGTHMDTLKPKNSKSITFTMTMREGFFTFWAILSHSAPTGTVPARRCWRRNVAATGHYNTTNESFQIPLKR